MASTDSVDVSVIVPAYNTEAYIEECLQSLFAQTLPSLEIVVVIDASPDGVSDVVARLQAQTHRQLRVIHLPQNVGLAEARNIGMRAASGKYLGFVDSDDYADPQMFARLFELAEQGDAEVVCCGWKTFSAQHSQSVFPESMAENTMACNKLIARALVERQQLAFPRGEWFEDELFSYQALLLANRVLSLNAALYFYRMNPEGICRSSGKAVQRLHGRRSSVAAFMRGMASKQLHDRFAEHCLELLCRHAWMQLQSSISWPQLQAYFRFTDHLIAKYQLASAREQLKDNYFVSRYFRWHNKLPALWLLQQRSRRAQA
ncbi:glycosyltransferase family 2 protein [Aliagarivorans marinus]|uniref:glycosyltransferase family 2 protein n=1 Tax=Aliagarivorans marinus TaxID=561965 RepID=UPI0004135818|nr:glycosyltransferase family 2 protein [Aliagarivorans marinus]